jgi:hypothetical protein
MGCERASGDGRAGRCWKRDGRRGSLLSGTRLVPPSVSPLGRTASRRWPLLAGMIWSGMLNAVLPAVGTSRSAWPGRLSGVVNDWPGTVDCNRAADRVGPEVKPRWPPPVESCRAATATTVIVMMPPAQDAKPVKADSRLEGIYPAGSRIKDEKVPGGFKPCDNYPLDLGKRSWGAKDTITLIAFPEEQTAYFEYQGIALRLINRTAGTAAFEACHSCLYIVQEALDDKGRWREIEEPPCAICRHSFHRVFLKADQFLVD